MNIRHAGTSLEEEKRKCEKLQGEKDKLQGEKKVLKDAVIKLKREVDSLKSEADRSVAAAKESEGSEGLSTSVPKDTISMSVPPRAGNVAVASPAAPPQGTGGTVTAVSGSPSVRKADPPVSDLVKMNLDSTFSSSTASSSSADGGAKVSEVASAAAPSLNESPLPSLSPSATVPPLLHKFYRIELKFSTPELHGVRQLHPTATPLRFESRPITGSSTPPTKRKDGDKGSGGGGFLGSIAMLASVGASGGSTHNVKCNGCKMEPIVGPRWQCFEEGDVNLCDVCYIRGHHGHERNDILYPLLSSECQEIVMNIAGNNPKRFQTLMDFFKMIDDGELAKKLKVKDIPGYEISNVPFEWLTKFFRTILPVLQQRHDIQIHTNHSDEPPPKKAEGEEEGGKERVATAPGTKPPQRLRIRCTRPDQV
jgi:hypothetical protein